ncbi:MAG: hypothetical protein JWO13_2295 [Acidobacteriales bacterium]|nr:hypothetical protein [Terriglobales bacterium]
MDLHHKIYAGLISAVLVIGGAGFCVSQYVAHAKEESARDAIIAVTEKQNTELLKANGDLKKDIEQIKSATAVQTSKLEAVKSQLGEKATPAQVEKAVRDYTPLQGVKVSQDPDAPSTLSQKDAVLQAQFGISCRQCELNRDALSAENAKQLEQLKNDDKVIAGLKTERDVAIKAAKGGSWVRRVGRAAKYIAIGAAIGYGLHH